jgi:hypothetical protein
MLKTTVETPKFPELGVEERAVMAFYREAGPLVVEALQSLLGTDDAMILQPEYASRKPRLKAYRAYPGKPADQPLILSGDLIGGVEWWMVDDGSLHIGVIAGAGIAEDGYDYASKLERLVHYLEEALRRVRPALVILFGNSLKEALLVRVGKR